MSSSIESVQSRETGSSRPAAPRLALVLPCYDEADVVESTAAETCALLESMARDGVVDPASFVYFVDDGSRDETWARIARLHEADPRVKGLKLSRNFGHQGAQLAGMMAVRERVDCAVTLDADLQHDLAAIPRFLEAHAAGAEIVFGVRRDRSTDGFFKRLTATGFYRLMDLLGAGTIPNHADYRLVGPKALAALAHYRESNVFLRGIFSDLGFQTAVVPFEVRERSQGRSKYSLRRMVSLALSGIASFSVVPLRLVAIAGLLIWLLSIAMMVYILFIALVAGRAVPGWASTTIPIYFLGGLQLLALGIVGEYVGRLYKEAKRRPRYLEDVELF